MSSTRKALVEMLTSGGSRTFGDLAERYYNVLFTPLRQGQCRRVDVVFDPYDVQEFIKLGGVQAYTTSKAIGELYQQPV